MRGSSHSGIRRKGAVMICSVSGLDVHRHSLKPGFQNAWNPKEIQFNHYKIQSKEYFEKTKMSRGDISRSAWDSIRA